MNREIYDTYVEILETELVPALGCTEPIAIAFASAKATELLKAMPQKVSVVCSGNIIKNVMGVTVPNSGGHRGIATAAVLGVLGGKSENKLEVLSTITAEQQSEAQRLIADGYCTCELAEGVESLYVEVIVYNGKESATVVVQDSHLNIVKMVGNDKILYSDKDVKFGRGKSLKEKKDLLDLKEIYEFAKIVEIKDVESIIERQIEYNSRIAEEGIKNTWGAQVGKTLMGNYDYTDIKIRAKAYASAASDARMNGCSLPVVINSGSGNQGITVSVPVIEYAKEWGKTREELIRALIVSNLVSLLQKKHIGNLSAYCGAVSAGAGAGAGIAFLNGNSYEEISFTITNTLANVGGIVCDGAKSSCAGKIASSLDAAILGFTMATVSQTVFLAGEGLVKENASQTIESFGRLGKDGMKETDMEILKIMLEH